MTERDSAEEQPHRVELTATARRTLFRLPEKIVSACIEFISGPLATNPYRVGKPLGREFAGRHSARRGSYRVVFRVEESSGTIFVVRIDHRADVYR
ncbi:type II toxin-antitoxin system RelE family toxin [Haloactinomyces albus]|uniref:mRNA-degrading endonuclease RelE of RelBE toxin-antitoxin system n=1 Tax=Haloactinomyces albus TaxID=1352928 RepID=A0AAE4CN79_9ACTN|nr:mRNA-degrading endonuclease RelE of RelBE toxin-antitoxin system [Haloactinomyces albus]